MMVNDTNDPRALADKIFEAGLKREDIAEALANLGKEKALFLSRLAVRAALNRGDDDSSPVSTLQEDEADSSLFQNVRAAYEKEKAAAHDRIRPKDLSNMTVWAAAKAAFGNDTTFVIKLAGRSVSTPTNRFIRYAADVLGVAIDQVRQHFSGTLPRGLVGAEFKSSGKPDVGGVEDFAAAVDAANIPDALKARWLEE